jgi:hypothetical protein
MRKGCRWKVNEIEIAAAFGACVAGAGTNRGQSYGMKAGGTNAGQTCECEQKDFDFVAFSPMSRQTGTSMQL